MSSQPTCKHDDAFIRARTEEAKALSEELLQVALRHIEKISPAVACYAVGHFLAHFAANADEPCELVSILATSAHEALHKLGLVEAHEDDCEESLADIPDEEFLHA